MVTARETEGGCKVSTVTIKIEPSQVINDVLVERVRQLSEEGYDTAHDDAHVNGELAMAAACYTIGAFYGWEPKPDADGEVWQPSMFEVTWPWDFAKPKDKRRDLVRAAALILAELERIDRASQADGSGDSNG